MALSWSLVGITSGPPRSLIASWPLHEALTSSMKAFAGVFRPLFTGMEKIACQVVSWAEALDAAHAASTASISFFIGTPECGGRTDTLGERSLSKDSGAWFIIRSYKCGRLR